jgi:hypothetical protein
MSKSALPSLLSRCKELREEVLDFIGRRPDLIRFVRNW